MNTRQRHILEWLQSGDELAVSELAARLDVTLMTIRRDLQALEEAGTIIRTHGGAVLSRPGKVEFTFQRQSERMLTRKRAIARAATVLIQPGMAVSLDTGTTTLEVARALAGMHDLRVLTSSLAIASALYACDGIDLVLLGGQARKDFPDLYGELTEQNLARFRVDVAVLGADAVHHDGLFTTHPDISRVSQAMIRHAAQRVLVADSSKLGQTAFIRFAGWEDIQHVVTDTAASPADRAWLADTGAEVLFAND